MSVHLLDVNVLIALAWPQHVHHAPAHKWFGRIGHAAWATCPLTETAFVRISSNPKIIVEAVSPREAVEVLRKIVALPGHHFWGDAMPVPNAPVFASLALVGHRQVNDAYLVGLAQHQGERLATFDRGVAELLPTPKERTRYVTIIEV